MLLVGLTSQMTKDNFLGVRRENRPLEPETSANTSLQAQTQKLLRFDGEFHRQFFEHLSTKPVDNHVDRVFRRDAALPAVEKLILANFRRRRLMLDL